MSKQSIPLVADDISQFSKALSKQLEANEQPLSHVRLLNLLAKANGYKNYQHLHATFKAHQSIANDVPNPVVDYKVIERCLNQFDDQGVLQRWPSRLKVQEICIWVFWSLLPADTNMAEKKVNQILNAAHVFGDAALLRRTMIGKGMISRNTDGSDYRRIEQKPSEEAIELIKRIGLRRQS
ncbi:DUF2087 domain-containing protein [Maritalea sp.]|uniref:DUF2087 domain-containing protein n=1 Tax=Maritalea sp. TaxID=2003361 RepID=UPI003EF67453